MNQKEIKYKKLLLDVLKQITPVQFAELIYYLNVENGYLPASDKPQIERAIALLNLAQAPGGMGLGKIEATLRELKWIQVTVFNEENDDTSSQHDKEDDNEVYRKDKTEQVPSLQEFTFETKKVETIQEKGFMGLGKKEIQRLKSIPGKAKQYKELLPDEVKLEMVEIPGGRFLMGGTEYEREKPQHLVSVKPFYMGKYPVTQEQWLVIAQNRDLKVDIDLNPEPSRFKGVKRPVENVNWYECVEFCQRLSKLTRRDYRLPSEAQWEYACRAGTTTPYYCGETITPDLANYDDNRGGTTPVGEFPPNGFGLYDMHGNVWEWCLDDWHDNYQGAPNDGSAWMEFETSYLVKNKQNSSYSVLRGGSWGSYPNYCRSAIRYVIGIYRREDRNYDNGFRVVCVFGRSL